jgi:hypothetical protein
MKRTLTLVFLACLSFAGTAESSSTPFAVVMYDRKTEKQLGVFPPGRNEYARVMTKLADAGIRGVVLKFFLDRETGFRNDNVLANAFELFPVFIQAAIDDGEDDPNPLDGRFFLKTEDSYPKIRNGKNAIIPLPLLAKAAYDVGFVNFRKPEYVPMIGKYRSKYVKSLWFSILSFLFPDLVIESGHLVNGIRRPLLTEFGEIEVKYPKKDNLKYVSFVDIINNKWDADMFKDKLVIIGYDGNNIDRISISTGNIKAHRVFVYALCELYRTLQ